MRDCTTIGGKRMVPSLEKSRGHLEETVDVLGRFFVEDCIQREVSLLGRTGRLLVFKTSTLLGSLWWSRQYSFHKAMGDTVVSVLLPDESFCQSQNFIKSDLQDEMVNSGSLNGGRGAATDLEKGEVWEEDLEGENYETEEGGDLEKRGRRAVCEISEPSLSEPLLTPEEAEHQGLAAASRRLVPMDKIILSVLVISFVVIEAYFVGRSFRNWIDTNDHVHDDNGKDQTGIEPTLIQLELPVLAPIDGGGGGGGPAGPSEIIWDGTLADILESAGVTMKESSEELSPTTIISTKMAHLPPDVEIDSQTLVLPLMEEEAATISTENESGNEGGS